MTVSELIAALEEMPATAEVRLATQPSWPIQSRITENLAVADDRSAVYIGEAAQVYNQPYVPSDIAAALWGE